jgi:alpha-L-arabinofuranosidase
MKIVNVSASSKPVKVNLEGVSFQKTGSIETLKAKGLYYYNSITNPKLIYPSSGIVTVSSKMLSLTLDPRSVNVIILDYKK